MSRRDSILVIVDPRARHHAGLAKGALLAQEFRARLDLFAYNDRPTGTFRSFPGRSVDKTVQAAEATASLNALARPLRDRGLDVATQSGSAESLNVALAAHLEHSCALIVVKDVRRDANSGQTALSHSDWELARTCPVSLLLSKSKLWPAAPQIGAAIDPGYGQRSAVSLDHAVLEQGAGLAGRLGGKLHVLHAYVPHLAEDNWARDVAADRGRSKLRSLEALVAGYGVPSTQVHLATGGAVDVLTRYARQLATSILVMGAVSRSPLHAKAIGSTAEGLLKQLSCDVLVAKAPPAASLH